MTLPQALVPMGDYRQWIVYKTEPTATPGKLSKLPCDWRTGHTSNSQDPANWVSYDEALEAARVLGMGVGFVFTDKDPFWFVDIDKCLTPSGWSPLANEICAMLNGAAVEISISETGLHLFGVGVVPPHASRSSCDIELYTEGRFVAIGTGAIGNVLTDCSVGMAALVPRYFERRKVDRAASEWTTKPCAEWAGPTDDDELIRRITRSKGASSVFGSKASAADLWDCNVTVLTGAYPDAARGFDSSSADAALVQHLAFWTGKDCGRIERLMRKSKLVRPKWDEHSDYMQRTILQAVGQQSDVLKDKPLEVPTPAAATTMRDVVGETWLTPEHQKIMFAGCTYVSEDHAIMMPDGSLYNEGRFNVMCGGFSYVLESSTSKIAKSPWQAFIDSRDVRFPKVAAREFAPARGLGEIWTDGNTSRVNSYVPIKVAIKEGNPAPFLNHLAKLLPVSADRDILLAYMAAIVQYPGVKFQWAPLLQGCEGNGKTLLSRCITEAVGRAHCHTPKASQLASRFNDWIEGCIFVAVEDVFPQENDDLIEALTPMITNDWLEIEGKGAAKTSRRVCANFMLNANRKDALRKTRDGRRFAIFYTKQQSMLDLTKDGMTGEYFPDLYHWLARDGYAIVSNYLKNYAIPAALNPAGDCVRAPVTSSTEEAILASVGRLEQEIIECIEQDAVGFRGGWISSHFLDCLIESLHLSAKYPRNSRAGVLHDLGYNYHPGLPLGQLHNSVSPDGIRSRLYIREGHQGASAVGAEVGRLYSDAQNTAPPTQSLRAVG